ncbi:MAG: redoxin domain-containing protein [Acidimicrobiia bacterium]|nr:redoxin domain-containing protein [Acidimicrobiia bacterium]
MRIRSLLAPLLLAGLLACGADAAPSAGGDTDTDSGSDPVVSSADPAVEAELLAFTAPTIDGGEVDFAALQGQDLVVWFWAPWCGSCAAEAEGVARVAADLGDQAPFVGIGSQAEVDELAGFVDRFTLTEFPQVADPDGTIWLRFADDVIRSSFLFIDDTGEMTRTGYGEMDEAQLRERVEQLIAS